VLESRSCKVRTIAVQGFVTSHDSRPAISLLTAPAVLRL